MRGVSGSGSCFPIEIEKLFDIIHKLSPILTRYRDGLPVVPDPGGYASAEKPTDVENMCIAGHPVAANFPS